MVGRKIESRMEGPSGCMYGKSFLRDKHRSYMKTYKFYSFRRSKKGYR